MQTDDKGSLPEEDNPEWTPDDIAHARTGIEVLNELGVEAPPVRRGRPPSSDPKDLVSLRIRRSTLEHFKSGGKGWQSRIDESLHKIVSGNQS